LSFSAKRLEMGRPSNSCGEPLFLLVFLRSIGQAAQVPEGDPYLAESIHYLN
jgi:hypothetical protein